MGGEGRARAIGRRINATELVAAPSHATRSSEPLLLRVTEVARLMSLSRSTVYQLVAKGEIQVVRIGSAVRVPRTELVRLTEAE